MIGGPSPSASNSTPASTISTTSKESPKPAAVVVGTPSTCWLSALTLLAGSQVPRSGSQPVSGDVEPCGLLAFGPLVLLPLPVEPPFVPFVPPFPPPAPP